ncbi:hypothetical protein D3C71_1282160 [compost metagenome]
MPGRRPYRSTTASLMYTPVRPGGTGRASPTRGRVCAGSSPKGRLSTVSEGRVGDSCSGLARRGCTRSNPGNCPTASAKPAGSNVASPPPVPPALRAERTYSGDGSTASSHCVTDPRKLDTITVSATARLRDATTPPTAMAALPRMRRARSSASSGSAWRAARGCSHASNRAMHQGSKAMPPTSSSAMATYAASGMPNTGGALVNKAPVAIKTIPIVPLSAWLAAAPRPFRVWAGGRVCAARAGHQPPAKAAATPSAPYTRAAGALHCSAGRTPAK